MSKNMTIDEKAEEFVTRNSLIRRIYSEGNPNNGPEYSPEREDSAIDIFFSGQFFDRPLEELF